MGCVRGVQGLVSVLRKGERERFHAVILPYFCCGDGLERGGGADYTGVVEAEGHDVEVKGVSEIGGVNQGLIEGGRGVEGDAAARDFGIVSFVSKTYRAPDGREAKPQRKKRCMEIWTYKVAGGRG